MTNQEIFNLISELECALYYKRDDPGDIAPDALEDMHKAADILLHRWHELTGCTNY